MTRLALLDQAAFLRLRATNQGSILQCTWLYDRDVDVDELRSFRDNLGSGLLGRRIECSPLPFGRHRWVLECRSPDIAFEARRPRSEVGAWIEERARVRVDPERGPTFHLGVLPLDDGGAAVSLVSSHCVTDGLGLVTAITEAVSGEKRNLDYPQPNSRNRWRAISEDLGHAAVALPAVLRALIATLLILLKSPSSPQILTKTGSRGGLEPIDDDLTALPSVTMQIDAAAWEARARSLNGSSNTLFVAFVARLAYRLARVQPDGNSVLVVLPVSGRRSFADDRANALSSITLTVDGRRVGNDLTAVHAQVKSSLASLEKQPNELLAGLPLTPFTPRWLVRRVEGIAMSIGKLPVGCSNLGSLDGAVGRIDGADATEVSIRLVEQGITRRRIEQAHGQLFCCTGTINGSRFITVAAYHSGTDNTTTATREHARSALADLRLGATTIYEGGI